MATVTVVTATRTLEIEASSIVDGEINAAGHLILTRHDGADIDMGAVSGMQMDPGTGYAKVDAFSYVGPTDPGAVPNGSVWYDTTDLAGPNASLTQKGLVELASNTETQLGVDTTRAVTPASLASIPGTKVEVVSGISENAAATQWPTGISMQSVTSGSGWSLEGGFGTIITNRISNDRTIQTFYATGGGNSPVLAWTRTYHSSTGGGGWTAWAQAQIINTLNPASFTQSSGLSSYPKGTSRLYFNTSNSTGWDFAGTAGEVITYSDGTEFIKQTWTPLHVSGPPETWVRTGNASGWSVWRKNITDPYAWTQWVPTWTSQGSVQPAIGNATVDCRYIKLGRLVQCKFEITFGSTTNFGSSPTAGDNWQFSLPIAAARSGETIGWMEMQNSIDKVCFGRAKSYSTTGFRVSVSTGTVDGAAIASSGDVDSLSPWTWESTDTIKGMITYESAS